MNHLKTKQQYQTALERFEEIFQATNGTKESDEADRLAEMIKKYEEKHFPIPKVSKAERAAYRAEQEKKVPMQEVWFQYVVDVKKYWRHGFTLKRLEKVKEAVLSDKDIMWDLLDRHGAKNQTPDEMKAESKERYQHCIGNFACNILYKMMDMKLIIANKKIH